MASGLESNKPTAAVSIIDGAALQGLGLPVSHVIVDRVKWIKWKVPNGMKLNVDGSARNDECSGGGLVRQSNGSVVIAFSAHYGHGTNNYAEAKALLQGISICIDQNINLTEIECDSLLIVNCVKQTVQCLWGIVYLIRQIIETLHSLGSYLSINHVYRDFSREHNLHWKKLFTLALAKLEKDLIREYQSVLEQEEI